MRFSRQMKVSVLWSLFSRTSLSSLVLETLSHGAAKRLTAMNTGIFEHVSPSEHRSSMKDTLSRTLSRASFLPLSGTRKIIMLLSRLSQSILSLFFCSSISCMTVLILGTRTISGLFHACLSSTGNSPCFAKILLNLSSKTC